ncbi:hypothetical protein MO973_06675 [Paenibacillus sp. TRM 82003]|nr:hypothetical protein [Paenibacillus sp. TRM 82003]
MKEAKELAARLKHIKAAKVPKYNGVLLREPRQEQGVFTIYQTLDTLDPSLFPYRIIDYDMHSGINVLAVKKNANFAMDYGISQRYS